MWNQRLRNHRFERRKKKRRARRLNKLILASASPRRRELLALLGIDYTIVVSRFDEATLSQYTDGREYVQRAAESKAEEVASRCAGWILGVDTDVVAPNGQILGKPIDVEDAKRMLRLLSGQTHTVFSGIALLTVETSGEITRRSIEVVETKVTMADLPEEAIAAYVATGEPLDKAGGYGIQGGALPFVVRVEGDPSNVIGLPLWPVAKMLSSAGVPLWRT